MTPENKEKGEEEVTSATAIVSGERPPTVARSGPVFRTLRRLAPFHRLVPTGSKREPSGPRKTVLVLSTGAARREWEGRRGLNGDRRQPQRRGGGYRIWGMTIKAAACVCRYVGDDGLDAHHANSSGGASDKMVCMYVGKTDLDMVGSGTMYRLGRWIFLGSRSS